MPSLFVPDDFQIPIEFDAGWCHLRPLAVADSDADLAAWRSSVEHIRATPGFAGRDWPVLDYPVGRNPIDIAEHVADFGARRGFTYAVFESGELIGCVYIYPPSEGVDKEVDAEVRSWVRARSAKRDGDLYRLVSAWLAEVWPFKHPDYAPRS